MYCTQWARKFKKFQAKKLVKSNKSFFSSWNCIYGSFKLLYQLKNRFLAIFEIAKSGIWSKKFFREIDLFNFLAWTFLNFVVHTTIGFQFSRKKFLTKFHFLPFRKWPKINFWTGKKFKTARNAISRKKLIYLISRIF